MPGFSTSVGFLAGLGVSILIGLNIYELGQLQGIASAKCKPPKVIYRVDSYSPTELRRIANWRERLERVK